VLPGLSGQRHEIVLADALQHEKHNGDIARIRDEVRTPWWNGKSLTPDQMNFFLWLLKKYSN